ncbi:uncharacterized protein isoform X4 [Rhodnius prolixus]|uniref:uncharacterized protein isoform X4 n=1 Tax=Rhodnius prolixus TaxID=13249 RepID=UPI003D18F3B2
MQQSMIAESCRIDEKQKYDQIKGNPLDFCYFHARDSTISTESSQKDELLPRLVQNLDDITKSVLSADLVKFISKMESIYKKFRRFGPKFHRIGLPTTQFFKDNFEKIRVEVCPGNFKTKNEKFEVLRIVCDYDRHSKIIKKLVDAYCADISHNSLTTKKSTTCVIAYILLRMLNEVFYDDIYEMLNTVAPIYQLLPLTHFLLKKEAINLTFKLGLPLFDKNYVKKMFYFLNNKGWSLMKKYHDKLLHLFLHEIKPKMKEIKLKSNLEQYLNIQHRNKDLDDSVDKTNMPTKMKNFSELTDKTPRPEEPVGSLIDYKRMLDLAQNEGVITFKPDFVQVKRKKKRFPGTKGTILPSKIIKQTEHSLSLKEQERESIIGDQRAKVLERITEVLLKYNQSPWSLSEDERKIVERLEMEPEWFLKEGYSDEEFLTETKKKGEPFYEITQRRGLELSGVKNRCCMHEQEINKLDFSKFYKKEEKSLKYLKKMTDFRKNNASVLREAATLSKEEDELIEKIKKLETGATGLLEYKKMVLEREIQEEMDKAMAVKRNHYLALLSLERALLAKRRLGEKNAELGKMLKEEKKMLDEKQRLLNEQDYKRRKKLVEEIQDMKENIREKLQILQLDNWIEARYANNMMEDMKAEKKAQEAREMQKRRDEIEEIRALKYLNKKENVMDCPPAIDRLWNLKLPGMPLAAMNMELKLAKAREMEDLQRKKEAAFELNARRKCLKKVAEEYVESRRTLFHEKRCFMLRKIRQPVNITVESKELQEIKRQLKEKKKKPSVFLRKEIPKPKLSNVKVPPPVTSLDTFFANLVSEVKWEDEEELSDSELHRNKMNALVALNEEKEIFEESDKIREIVEITPELLPKPLLLKENIPAFVFRSQGALKFKQPFHKIKIIFKKEELDKIVHLLKQFRGSFKVKSKKKTPKNSLFISRSEDSLSDVSLDYMYHNNRRYIMLPQEETEQPDWNVLDIPTDSILEMSKTGKGKGVAEEQILNRYSGSVRTSKSSQAERKSMKKLQTVASDNSLVDEEATDGESSDEKVYEEESFEVPEFKIIDGDDIKEITDEEKFLSYYKKVLKFLDLPEELTRTSSANILFLKSMIFPKQTSSMTKGKNRLSFGLKQANFDNKIPSSTALEYLLKMHPVQDSQEPHSKLPRKVSFTIVDRPTSGVSKSVVFRQSEKERRLKKLQEALAEFPKQDRLTQLATKKLKQVNVDPNVKESTSKPFRYMPRNYKKQYFQFLKRIPRKGEELSKPKVYPPYNLKTSSVNLEKLGINSRYRLLNRRLIIPGNCRYIQQQFFLKGKKKKKASDLKKKPLTKRAECLRRKFEQIDEFLISRFPPPYSTDSIIFQYFPSLNKIPLVQKHREFIESLKQKSSLPVLTKRKNNNSPSFHKESKSFVPSLPSPLGSKSYSSEERSNTSRKSVGDCMEMYSEKSSSKYEPKGIHFYKKSNLKDDLVINELKPYKNVDNYLMRKLHGKFEDNTCSISTSTLDLCCLEQKSYCPSSAVSTLKETNSEECFRFFSVPIKRRGANLNTDSKIKANISFLPPIKLPDNRESKCSNATIKLPPIKKI